MARYQILLDGKIPPWIDPMESWPTSESADVAVAKLQIENHWLVGRLTVAEREIGVSFGTPPTGGK